MYFIVTMTIVQWIEVPNDSPDMYEDSGVQAQ